MSDITTKPQTEREKKLAERYGDAWVEQTILMHCMRPACDKTERLPMNSLEASGIFNYFCSGECEDRYAATL